ncbi:class I SAM-dependent DNA methyltransferase [Paenirhodobacter populi]|uniref:Methyltransferase domain-containing protein n=1 Tax=Paenirhodobacter populi TaxID=2306993 RepID=A0A443JH68_9RHOB|nr:methyltransferase domain-containing protein [Sinirhodobacter populi]RWR19842.1 methyltransferase domain-containing protein [Sinirhodobacter populi]
MTPMSFSSGDLIADRRADYAEALLTAGDAAAAADLYLQALDIAPGWTAGWFRLGEIREAHRLPDAAAAYERALALDPSDVLGARLRLDLIADPRWAETMPSAFVEALFDQYAGHFDEKLVGALGYRAPQLLRAGLAGRYARALDLGCGTGLMGAELRAIAGNLEGWDISAEMLREAGAKGIYDRLEKVDLARLAGADRQWDLITAADVFAYVGALERVVGWVALALAPGGTFAFTTEACPGDDFILQGSRRYAHSETYLRGLLDQAGFTARFGRDTVRMDRGAPIEGLVVFARRRIEVGDRAPDGDLAQV